MHHRGRVVPSAPVLRLLFSIVTVATFICAVLTVERVVAAARSDREFRELTQEATRIRDAMALEPDAAERARLREVDVRLEAAVSIGLERAHERNYGLCALAILVPLTGIAYLARRREASDDATFGAS